MRAVRVLVCVCVLVGLLVLASVPGAWAASAPVVDGQSVSDVGYTTATFAASIDPSEADTTYRFEYGPTASHGAQIPLKDADIGSGSVDVSVSNTVSGLQPDTAYHYRVVAVNAEGTTAGADAMLHTFATPSGAPDTCANAQLRGLQSSAYLPDCRAYELVSPAEKEGGDVAAAQNGGTQSSQDGERIKFDSLIAFGDSHGFGTKQAEYVSARGPEGWTTHGIDPPQGSLPLGIYVSSWYTGLSEDLSKGVYLGYTPVLPRHPNVEHAANLYLRTDLLSAPPGNYELLSDAIAPVTPLPSFFQNPSDHMAFAGATSDFKHIIFETYNNLTAETSGLNPELPKLYEWNEGALRLAGVLPSGEPAGASVAGRGAGGGTDNGSDMFREVKWTPHAISRDGSRMVFTGPPFEQVNIGFQASVTGNLYMRIDGKETIQLNVSERSVPDPSGHQPAEFWGATPDDSKVYFTTAELLTDNASNGTNLYMYDVNAPTGKHLTLITVDDEPFDDTSGSHKATAVFVDGISEDGSYVYFLGENKLIAGQPAFREQELYVWHEGSLRALTAHFDPQLGGVPWGENTPSLFQPQESPLFRMTSDGRTIAFVVGTAEEEEEKTSVAPLTGLGKLPPGAQAIVYDYETNRAVCVSCDSSGDTEGGTVQFGGEEGHGEGAITEVKPTLFSATQYLSRPLSADGRYVFFDTMDTLLPQDTNGKRDVYEYDTHSDELHMVSSGACDCESTFVDASADGSNVFFTTRQRLVRMDIDKSGDLYDARIDGGIQMQNEALPPPCEGDDCQGPAKLAPTFSLPASSTFSGPGNTPTSASVPVTRPRAKGLSKAQRLARALRACRTKPKRTRVRCQAQARHRYGAERASRTRVHKSLRRAGL